MTKTKYEKSLIFVFFLLLLYALFFFWQNYQIAKQNEEEVKKEKERIELIRNKIESLELEAKAISVYDITNDKKLYGKNDTLVLPLASLSKIMTALVALVDYKDINEIQISVNALNQVGDNSLYLHEKWDPRELVKFMLLTSSNDAAVALSENNSQFLEKMNEKAKRLGLANTIFYNTTGLDTTLSQAGAYSTAEEMNTLASFALLAHPDIFPITAFPDITFISQSGLFHEALNTNTSITKIPNPVLSKTGSTLLAPGNLTLIFKNKEDEEIVVTVLGSSFLGRFSDMEKIVNVLYNE